MHTGAANCDWAGFLIECEPDLFQQHYLEEWNALIVCRLTAWAQKHQTRVHALGATTNGRRRYVLAVWGESATNVSQLPFAKWADHLVRYDVKRRLYDIRPDTYERLTVALQFAETKRNVEAFRLPKRTKNTARDSGGEGVRFGSRKSDICTKLSRRGNEVPYFETQVQDDKLSAAVLDALMDTEDSHVNLAGWVMLLHRLGELQMKHIEAWLRAAGIDKSIDGLKHDDIPMPARLRAMFQLELWGEPRPEPKTGDENAAYEDMHNHSLGS